MTFKAIVSQEEDGGYWAKVPALPGCATQGDTLEELEKNLREAIEGWLAVEEESAVKVEGTRVMEIAM